MYYPYLRSKQNEMLALREIAQSDITYSHVMPIIEPVRELATLDKTIQMMESANIHYAVILNAKGYKADEAYAWLTKDEYCNYAPAFLCDDSISSVKSSLDSLGEIHDVILVFKNDIDSDNEELLSLLTHPSVATIVGHMSRSLRKKLSQESKQLVTFNADAFRAQNSNAQYDNVPDELYTEEHSFYKDDNYDGFSDFCVLPKDLQEGGMTPTTLAIHLTYKKNEDEIWVKHFLSDNRYGRENIQHKFKEAAVHVKEFYDGQEIPKTEAVEQLLNCLQQKHYPGLGKLKEFSVWNHLELINDFLENNR